jgi:uncharacterized protein involved in exopolysaccharide biosynthesis
MNETDEHVKSALDYVYMLKRRKVSIMITSFVVIALSVMLAFGLPSIYQSKATILIQDQKIPKDFIRGTIDSFAAQQVQIIRQQVITLKNITDIAEKFNLYQDPDSDYRLPSTELAELFEKNMELELVNADIIDPKSGRPTSIVIAFSLMFSDPSSSKAQKVTSELVTMFLDENLRNRTEQTASAEEFFSSESLLLSKELSELEQKMADFKALHDGSLPEQQPFNVMTLERTHQALSDVKIRIQTLEQRKIELAAQLTQLDPSAPVVMPTGEVVLSNADRLKALQSEYRRKSAIYNTDHPDVLRLAREIQSLQSELGVETDVDELRVQLQEQNRRLAELQTKYKDSHQDIQTTRKLIKLLEKNIQDAGNTTSKSYTPEPDNPAYILLQTQLDTVSSELRSVSEKRIELEEKVARYEAQMERAPDVEREYQALQRDYNTATMKYQEIRSRQREISVAKNLEEERKGERYILIEPPALPIEPVSPNRTAIFFIGLVLAAGAGLGVGLLREVMDGSIHGTAELAAIMGEAPLVAIPYIDNDTDIEKKRRAVRIGLASGLSALVLFVLFLHFFYTPLDVLYFMLLNRLGFN